jgi:hypothetical protein
MFHIWHNWEYINDTDTLRYRRCKECMCVEQYMSADFFDSGIYYRRYTGLSYLHALFENKHCAVISKTEHSAFDTYIHKRIESLREERDLFEKYLKDKNHKKEQEEVDEFLKSLRAAHWGHWSHEDHESKD